MKLFPLTILVLVILFGAALPLQADPLKIVPLLSFKQEYSDNILFSSNNEEEDFITTLSGGLAIRQKKEILDAGLEVRLDQLLYHDFDELDSLDKYFFGHANYRYTERLGIGAEARYAEDSRRDREADTTGLLVSGDRESAQFSLVSDYLFSEILKGDISLGYGRVETREINNNEENDDFRVDITFSRDLSKILKNTKGLLNLSYLHYTSDIETITPGAVLTSFLYQDYRSDIFQFSTGLSRDITELYNVYCLGGASFSRTKEGVKIRQTLTGTGVVAGETSYPDQEDDTWGGVFLAGVKYKGLYYDMGLSLSQDMRGASGTNGVVQRSSAAGNILARVTENFSLTLDISCYLNENERKTQADTEDLTFNLQPGFRYRFSRDFTLSGIYRFTSIEDRQNNTTSERSMIYFVIRKEFEF